MFQKIENYLILKNSENFEEHIAKIIELEKESRKIKLQLIDENKNIYYKRNKELEVLIPHDKELFLVCPAWIITRWCKSTIGFAMGTIS